MKSLRDIASRPATAYAFVAGLALAMMLPWLGTRTVETHEAYVAVTARAMADPQAWLDPSQSPVVPPHTPLNHWLVPVCNGRVRLEKTPLAYWAVAGLARLGLPVNGWTVRLPPAAALAGLCLLVLHLGRRMFDARTGLLAAGMLATSLGAAEWGRSARADMLLTFLMTAGMTCFYRAAAGPGGGEPPASRPARSAAVGRFLWIVAGFAALGAANLAKQFVPLMLALPVGVFLLWQIDAADPQAGRRLGAYVLASLAALGVHWAATGPAVLRAWSVVGLGPSSAASLTTAVLLGGPLAGYAGAVAWRRSRRPRPAGAGAGPLLRFLPGAAVGVPLMLAMFLPWLWYMGRLFPQAGAMFHGEVAARALGEGRWSDPGPPGFYLAALAILAAPWTVLLPGGLALPWMRRFAPQREALVFLLLWVAGLVATFSAAAGKRDQYLLPALPAACLLMARCATDLWHEHRWLSGRWATALAASFLAVAVAGALAAGGAMVWAPARAGLAAPVLAIAVAAALPLGAGLALRRRGAPPKVAYLALAAGAGFLAYAAAANAWPQDRQFLDAAAAARQWAPQGVPVVSWGSPDAQTVYYYGRNLPALDARRQTLLARHGPADGPARWRSYLRSVRGALVVLAPAGAEARIARDLDLVALRRLGALKAEDSLVLMGPPPSAPGQPLPPARLETTAPTR